MIEKADLLVATRELNSTNKLYLSAVAEVSATHREIGKLAVHAFMNGGGIADLESILSSTCPQEMIDNLSTLENLGADHQTSPKRFKSAEGVAQHTKIIAVEAKQRQALVTDRVTAVKKEADDVKMEQQKEVNKLQAVQDKLQRDLESAKKVRITLEQKRQLAKKPYIWGSEGPNSFDCSGLVYAAFKYAGLGWPIGDHLNSGLYYTYTKQVPIAEIQPGDLIFYSYKGTQSTIHHMSIYAGGGMMWEVRSTAIGLRYSNIYSVLGMMPFVGRV